MVKDEAPPTDHPPPPPDNEVQVDESLFDVPPGDEDDVTVDESLFDIDNLQDLDLNDPAILQAPS